MYIIVPRVGRHTSMSFYYVAWQNRMTKDIIRVRFLVPGKVLQIGFYFLI